MATLLEQFIAGLLTISSERKIANNNSTSAKILPPIWRLWKLNFSCEVCHSAKKQSSGDLPQDFDKASKGFYPTSRSFTLDVSMKQITQTSHTKKEKVSNLLSLPLAKAHNVGYNCDMEKCYICRGRR